MTTTGLECDSSLTTTLIPVRHALGIKSPAITPTAYYILCQSPPQLGSRSRWISLWSYPSRTASTLFSCVSVHEDGSLHSHQFECHCRASGSTLFAEHLSVTRTTFRHRI